MTDKGTVTVTVCVNRPYGFAVTSYLFEARLFAVGEECSEQTAVQMIEDRDQQRLVKLKRVRELKQMRQTLE